MKEGGVLSEIRELAEIDYISGMKYKEIAEKYNISINTIKTQIFRGYKKLRESLSDDMGHLVLLFIQYRAFLVENTFLIP